MRGRALDLSLGAARALASGDNGTSPIIRDWSPTASPSRTVPRLSNLVNNTFAPGEILPTIARASCKHWVPVSLTRTVRSRSGCGESAADLADFLRFAARWTPTSPPR